MLAEKCPNCGAFLPVRRAGVEVRTCEFCELEVPGDVGVVEVDALTTRRRATEALADAPTSTWLPPPTPIRDVEATARRARRGVLTFVVVLLVAVVAVVAVILTAAGTKVRRVPPPPSPVAEAPIAVAAPPPPPRPEQLALTAAVEAAGGIKGLDPLALLPFVDGRARALAADAVLLSVQCFPVRAGGKADLTLAGGRCSYEYRSPAGTQRPADVPVGVAIDYPCQLSFDVDQDVDAPDARPGRTSLEHCRMHHAVRPPRCTAAEVWERAATAGAPADAVARLRYAGRYRSGYDPVDPSDEVDVPERGRWTVSIERDGAPDFRHDVVDDCGQAPPSADERAVLAALKKATPALARCFAKAAGRERSVEALEMIWRLAIDGRGAVTIAFEDPGVDLEGVFQGDLDGIRAAWAACADGVAGKLKLPAALREVRLDLRMQQTGELVVSPPPFE